MTTFSNPTPLYREDRLRTALGPRRCAAIVARLEQFVEQEAQALQQDITFAQPIETLAIARKAIYAAMWWRVVGGAHPIIAHVYRKRTTGDHSGEIWVMGDGSLECIINDPWLGEHNGAAYFRSNFPDEPLPGTQWQRATLFMDALGYEATGVSRPWTD